MSSGASRLDRQPDGLGLERDAHDHELLEVGRGDRLDRHAAVGLRVDEPFALQHPQRLAQRRAADAELVGQRDLRHDRARARSRPRGSPRARAGRPARRCRGGRRLGRRAHAGERSWPSAVVIGYRPYRGSTRRTGHRRAPGRSAARSSARSSRAGHRDGRARPRAGATSADAAARPPRRRGDRPRRRARPRGGRVRPGRAATTSSSSSVAPRAGGQRRGRRCCSPRRSRPGWRERGWGRIVHIVSDTVWRPPAPELLAYIDQQGRARRAHPRARARRSAPTASRSTPSRPG